MDRRAVLLDLFQAAVAAANPAHCLPPFLPEPPAAPGRLIVLTAGKAGASLAAAAIAHYRRTDPDTLTRLAGIAVTRPGYGVDTSPLKLVEAGHPVPDAAGLAATEEALRLAASATADDLVLVLLSGGASANWIAPAAGIGLEDKQAVTRALLRSGAPISAINTVRRHLSRIKGGRLAALAAPARMVTLAISDVPGDDPAVIGSGPTVPDPTTLDDARAIVARAGIALPKPVAVALEDPANETPKPGDPAFVNTSYRIVARPADAIAAAAVRAKTLGLEPVVLGDSLEGEAREIAKDHVQRALDAAAAGRAAVIISGGELTVTVRGAGRGGPNQEYALALAIALDGNERFAALAADTDGIDGGSGASTGPAGAYVDGTTAARGRAAGRDPAAFLADNDATGFFEAVDGLVRPGPILTNVNDFRAILVDTPKPRTA